jgi:hypothetical protein
LKPQNFRGAFDVRPLLPRVPRVLPLGPGEDSWTPAPVLYQQNKIISSSQIWLLQRVLNDLIRDQAYLRSYELVPPPPPGPSESCFSFSVFLCVAGPAYLLERGEGAGVEPNPTTGRKLGPLEIG